MVQCFVKSTSQWYPDILEKWCFPTGRWQSNTTHLACEICWQTQQSSCQCRVQVRSDSSIDKVVSYKIKDWLVQAAGDEEVIPGPKVMKQG